jgi:hypothetical protein
MSGLLTLADVDRRDSRFTPEQLDALTAAAPDQIGPWVVTLNFPHGDRQGWTK